MTILVPNFFMASVDVKHIWMLKPNNNHLPLDEYPQSRSRDVNPIAGPAARQTPGAPPAPAPAAVVLNHQILPQRGGVRGEMKVLGSSIRRGLESSPAAKAQLVGLVSQKIDIFAGFPRRIFPVM